MPRGIIVTISLPLDLVPVWDALPSKSGFVQDQLRILSGIEIEDEHVKFQNLQNMCSPFSKITCNLCYERFESMDHYRNEWITRTNFINDTAGAQEHIKQCFINGIKPKFHWHLLDGDEEE